MKISWVISEDIPEGWLNPKDIKSLATSWGSWKVWKSYRPDNCVCSTTPEAVNLIKRAFHAVCTFHIMQSSFIPAGRPKGVKLFNGEFKNNSINNKDDIIALNLAIPDSDIILLLGFNFSPILNTDSKSQQAAQQEYYYNMREMIKMNPQTQFVIVEYMHELASWVNGLDNLTFDSLDNVKRLLG